ncbi:hypothetical protein ACFV2I_13045 [Streptomyces microflavus]|uniref:Uncharacterized protein n=1 Tax=Streptomyces microflavus TaxID=1919 RepID=A0A6N9V8Z2_STRMI|nr:MULTISPECIES: hypothetical protein [Streptomyces]MBK3588247.1 hypothetical protein [Streptomyces sp. MBT57]MBK5996718.1 hypothetical protein [Streptomyces sp. MBT58]MBW3362467.1 hypothetical protein [Streptomyces sp. 09ZI22]MEE1734191.1 hypothetical protein [Streptomyces sp. BE282]MEE1734658.1 hypothetical protein [Streptomyces sp. BE282]
MPEFRQPGWTRGIAPLDESAGGQVFGGASPVAATPAVVATAGAVVIAFAAGVAARQLANGGNVELPM